MTCPQTISGGIPPAGSLQSETGTNIQALLARYKHINDLLVPSILKQTLFFLLRFMAFFFCFIRKFTFENDRKTREGDIMATMKSEFSNP